MTAADVLFELLDRLGAADGRVVLISDHELGQWPAASVVALKSHKVIVKASPASSAVCPGCEDECFMPVQVLPYPTGQAAFVVCDKRDDISRVPVRVSQLEQWQTSAALIADLTACLLGLRRSGPDNADSTRWEVGLFKGKKHSSHLVLTASGSVELGLAGHSVALADVLALRGDVVEIDQRMLTRCVDQPIAGAGDKESAAQRRERLKRRVAAERAKGNRAFLKTVAEEEEISVSRLKQILLPDPKPNMGSLHW